MDLKDKLKALREEEVLTQNALAKELNKIKITDSDPEIYTQTVSYWENGREPSLLHLKKLSKFYGVTTDFLLDLTNSDSMEEYSYEKNLIIDLKTLKDKLSNASKTVKDTLISLISNYYTSIDEAFFYDYDISKKYSKWTNEDLIHLYFYMEFSVLLGNFTHEYVYREEIKKCIKSYNTDISKNELDMTSRYQYMRRLEEISKLMFDFLSVSNNNISLEDYIKNQEAELNNKYPFREKFIKAKEDYLKSHREEPFFK